LDKELKQLEKSGQQKSSRANQIRNTLKGDDKGRGIRGSRASQNTKTAPSSEKASKPSAAERRMAQRAEQRAAAQEEMNAARAETAAANRNLAIIEDVVEVDGAIIVVGAVDPIK